MKTISTPVKTALIILAYAAIVYVIAWASL